MAPLMISKWSELKRWFVYFGVTLLDCCFCVMEILIICLPRPYLCLEYIELYSHISVALRACIAVLLVLHVWVSCGSSPEICGHFALLHVYCRHKYETFQDQNTWRGILSLC